MNPAQTLVHPPGQGLFATTYRVPELVQAKLVAGGPARDVDRNRFFTSFDKPAIKALLTFTSKRTQRQYLPEQARWRHSETPNKQSVVPCPGPVAAGTP